MTIRDTIEIVVLSVVIYQVLKDLAVSRDNCVDRRIFFEGSKIVFDQQDYF